MRKPNVLVLLTAITLAPATVLAQSSPPGLGSCSGSDDGGSLSGSVGLAIPDGNGGYDSVQAASIPYVFGAAECQCATQDIALEIELTTAFANSATPGTVEVWVGSGCDNYTTRTAPGQTACEQLTTGIPTFNDFTTASTAGPSIHVPIPAQSLFAPKTHVCSPLTLSNSIYVFIYNDPTNPLGACTLTDLTENAQPPTAVTDVQASSDKVSATGGVSVSWVSPPQTSLSPTSFELLCADEAGNPEVAAPAAANYSVCQPTGIERRQLPTGAMIGQPLKVRPDKTPASGTFASFDHRFVCGSAGAATNSVRLLLDPTKAHQIEVLAVDNFGNATPSPLLSVGAATGSDMGAGTTEPGQSHGCSMGGAAASSPWAVAFVLLALTALAVRGQRRRRL
jgi:MYXO-CTERM domain-containing protein